MKKVMIMVQAKPHRDPELRGKARIRKPWQPNRFFTEEPVLVERDPGIIRMIQLGNLIEVEQPKVSENKVEK